MLKKNTLIFTILFISVIFYQNYAASQTVNEKELFTLKYKGEPDVYSFYYDKASGKYCYLYFDDINKKSFLINNNSVSKKYDFISIYDKRSDSKGNTFIVAGDYSSDYGIDNNFLLVNGIEKLNYDYIESYSSFVNKNNEFVFIFKTNDKYRIGKYSIDKGLKQSDDYEFVRAVYKFNENSQKEGDADGYSEDDFYKDENGERCFIAVKNGKASLVYESKEIKTDFSDINDVSLTKNRNNELSYIAKKKGRFYEQTGDEVVISGNKVYETFQTVYPPVKFNSDNEPIYSCSDSVSENRSNYYLVKGNEKQNAQNANTGDPVIFTGWISDLKIGSDGSITYTGMDEVIIPADKTNPSVETYDEYFTKSYLVKNNLAQELGYNLGTIKYGPEGKMLYSGIADLNKKEYLLIESNGITNIILSNEKFDMIYEYGYTANNEIYYIGQNYEDETFKKKNNTKLFIGNNLIGSFDYLIYQTVGKSSSVLKFDSKNNYAFVGEEVINNETFSDRVYLNNKMLPFPVTAVKGVNDYLQISALMFSKNDIMFYIGGIKLEGDKIKKEIFIDNGSTGKSYDMIGDINYDSNSDEVNFLASKNERIYSVTVKFN